MKKIKLVSLNTNGGVLNFYKVFIRYKKIAQELQKESPDLIHFQEVFTYFHLLIFLFFLNKYRYHAYKYSLLGPRGGLVIFSKYPLSKTKYLKYKRKYIPYLSRSIVEILTNRGALVTHVLRDIT